MTLPQFIMNSVWGLANAAFTDKDLVGVELIACLQRHVIQVSLLQPTA